MKRFLILILFSFWNTVALATVDAQVSAKQIALGEQFQLSVISDNSLDQGKPNFSALKKEFMILGTAQSQSYTIINGKASGQIKWTLILEPKKTGKLVIPAFNIGAESTKPVEIEVVDTPTVAGPVTVSPDTNDAAETEKDVIENSPKLTGQVDQTNPYVNQQILYTVRLFNKQEVFNAEFHPPEMPESLVVPLGEGKHYQVSKNGEIYQVDEQEFAIFPQKSGEFTINPPSFNAVSLYPRPTQIRLKAKPINIHVKPIPTTDQNSWLPAKEVKLTDSYDNSTPVVKEGTLITRTIKIEGVGVPAQFLPDLSFQNKNYNAYPEKPISDNKVIGHDVVGISTIKVSYLLNKPGRITIPEIRLKWFNPEKGIENTAHLASRDITVIGTTASEKTDNKLTEPTLVTHSKPQKLNSSQSTNDIWVIWLLIIVAILLIALIVLLILINWGPRRQNVRTQLNALREVCLQNDAERARSALIKWARHKWPQERIMNLDDIIHLVQSAELKTEIEELSKAIYGTKKAQWQGQNLWDALTKKSHKKKKQKWQLPPINPQ